MTIDEALEIIGKAQLSSKYTSTEIFQVKRAFQHIKSVLEQQPCEDCISREAVEKITWEEPSYDDALNVLTEVRDKVRALPSVTPSRPKGKWIHWTDDYKDYVTCPSCGYGEEGEVLLADKTPFCPICGEDLRGEDHD